MKTRAAHGILLAAAALLVVPAALPAAPPGALPAVNAIVPNFYYKDLAAARRWYVGQVGFKPLYDDGWVVILAIGDGMQLALVDGSKGLMRPVEDKGMMLSIETDALEDWHRRFSAIDGVRWVKPEGGGPLGRINDHKDIQEFRVLDPGGYLIEFYRWKPEYRPGAGK